MYNTNTQTVEYDMGLRQYLVSIYNWMFLGLCISAASSYYAVSSGFVETLKHGGVTMWAVVLSPFILILVMAGGAAKSLPRSIMSAAFIIFTLLEGLSLSVIISRYTGGSVLTAFLATAAAFASLSLWGYTTKVNLSGMGSFFLMALVGLIVAMILSAFIPSPGFSLLVSFAGVVIFSGLVAYDTQTMRGDYVQGDVDGNARNALWNALNLYLDFLNLFIFLLRFVGVKKD